MELGVREPAALGLTQEVLGRELVAELPVELLVALLPNLTTLLGEIAVGFVRQTEAAILAAQEQARQALLQARQTAEVSLRTSEARLRLVVQNAPIILCAFDRNGMITLFEGRGLAALGRRPGELVGRSIWEGALAVPELPVNLQRALSGEEFTTRTRVRGAVFETHYALLGEQNMVTSVVGVATDITERVRAEATLRCFEAGLSTMERKVLPFLARSDLPSYREIGTILCLSGETVRDHMQAIALKLGVPARREAVVTAARELGLLPLIP